jgi:hypothetical protein
MNFRFSLSKFYEFVDTTARIYFGFRIKCGRTGIGIPAFAGMTERQRISNDAVTQYARRNTLHEGRTLQQIIAVPVYGQLKALFEGN